MLSESTYLPSGNYHPRIRSNSDLIYCQSDELMFFFLQCFTIVTSTCLLDTQEKGQTREIERVKVQRDRDRSK